MFEEFKKSTKKDWEEKSKSDLKGEDVYSKYKWNIGDLDILPMYDASDIENLDYLDNFKNQLAKDDDPSGDVRVWKNIQKIAVANCKEANKQALEALNNGADGVHFNFTKGPDNINVLLKNILPEYCHLEFSGLSKSAIEAVLELLSSSKSYHVFFHSHVDDQYDLIKDSALMNNSDLRFVSIAISPDVSLDDQVAQALSELNRSIRSLLIKGIDIKKISNSFALITDIGTDYFGEIAKTRAIRNQVFQLVRSYGHEDFSPEDVKIKCSSSPWVNEKYQPHSNMLKGSTAAMAGILGGCDILEIQPEQDNSLSNRIARNVSSVLKEESYLAKVADPVAGSYYLESLTDQISKSAWNKFISSLED
ncbi:MAG: methylmalonyl-CoA mutase family protein [Fulvivirga sp.]|uniref:methylmalonyl-CoA mutase family protein n=1 Tax=Fulvivirga sp. TaxID=1931237 RepID=UPI0032EDFCD4